MHWQYQYVSQMTAAQLQWAYDRLSPSRRAHVDSLLREESRAGSLTGEWLLRQLLRQHWGMEDPVILRGSSGCPVLQDAALYLSITHSADLVACAVSDSPIGIDAERLKPFRWAMMEKICTPEERRYLLQQLQPEGEICTDPDAVCRFFELWTGKEAWFKLQGTGIRDLRSVNVPDLNRQLHRRDDYLIQIVSTP